MYYKILNFPFPPSITKSHGTSLIFISSLLTLHFYMLGAAMCTSIVILRLRTSAFLFGIPSVHVTINGCTFFSLAHFHCFLSCINEWHINRVFIPFWPHSCKSSLAFFRDLTFSVPLLACATCESRKYCIMEHVYTPFVISLLDVDWCFLRHA